MTTAVRAAEGAAPVPLSYLIRESQYEIAQHLQRWFRAFVDVPGGNPPGTMARGIASYTDPNSPYNTPWTPERQVFQCEGGRWFRVTFDHHGWDAGASGYVYSEPTVISADTQVLADHSYLFDNRGGKRPLDVDLSEQVTYLHSRTTTTSRTIHADFGAKVTATLGGKESGGSLEGEISSAFGISDTDTDVKGESTSVTRTQAIRTKVDPGEALLATISSPTVVTRRTFDINAVWLAGMRIAWWDGYDEWGYVKQMAASEGRTTHGLAIPLSDDKLTEIRFNAMDEFVEMVQAVNVYWPKVGNLAPPYLDFGGISDAIDGRRVVAAGVEEVTEQHAADYRFEAVTNVSKALAQVREDHVITAAA